MVLDTIKAASLMQQKLQELLYYDKSLLDKLKILLGGIDNIKEMTKEKELEASNLETFPQVGYIYNVDQTFRDVTELKEWASEYLSNRTVVAVDGSQIGFDRHIRPQIAMVQTGYTASIRGSQTSPGTAYQGTFPKIYGPKDVAETLDEGVRLESDATVKFWRWEHEVKTAKCLIMTLKGKTPPCGECRDENICPFEFEPPEISKDIVALLDGTLILSFLTPAVREVIRNIYIHQLEDLLSFCEKNQVAIGAVIMNSSAKEITKSLWKTLTSEIDIDRIARELPADAYLLSDYLTSFGDRTPLMISHRDILNEYKKYGERIGFFYLRVDSQRPARIEAPSFVYEQGKLDLLWRTIAAESVLGRGYPYSLARAHDTAVLKGEDRNNFYNLLDGVLKGHGSCIRMSSKNRRKNLQLI
jgi:hypothetical protein